MTRKPHGGWPSRFGPVLTALVSVLVVCFAETPPALGGHTPTPGRTTTATAVSSLAPTSSNLSKSRAGYTFHGPVGSIGYVEGTFTVPRLVGNCSATAVHETVYFAVGASESLTGSLLTVQGGTALECNAGRVSHFAWYQFGSNPIQRPTFAFAPGDFVTVGITPNASQIWLDDRNTGLFSGYFTGPAQATGPRLAAYLVERALVNGTPAALPDFG